MSDNVIYVRQYCECQTIIQRNGGVVKDLSDNICL